MTKVNIYQAKTQLSRLLAQVEEGEEVVIARSGRPIARLVPFDKHIEKRHFGQDEGVLSIPRDFDEPLSDELLQDFRL